MSQQPPVTPELLLEAYCTGYFPMAERHDMHELYWFNPKKRSVLSLAGNDHIHITRTLAKLMKKAPFEISINRAFPSVIRACADKRTPSRKESWINDEIVQLYTALHEMGYAHSVECWANKKLAGGVYGVSIGGAFFGESMFSDKPSASKIALVYLAQHLKECGYTLFDAQFENPHLVQFGFKTISQKNYLERLRNALSVSPNPSSRFNTTSVIKS